MENFSFIWLEENMGEKRNVKRNGFFLGLANFIFSFPPNL